MPVIRRSENDKYSAASGSNSSNKQSAAPKSRQNSQRNLDLMLDRSIYLEYRKHVPNKILDQGNPFDGQRFTNEVINQSPNALSYLLATKLRGCYLPYAEEFLHYGKSCGWSEHILVEKYNKLAECCRKYYEDLVQSVVNRRHRFAQVGTALWDAVPIETTEGSNSSRGVVLFTNFGNMLAFHDHFEHFSLHQVARLEQYVKRGGAYVYLLKPHEATMKWLSSIDRDSSSEYQKYYDSQGEIYADLMLSTLPREGILPLKGVNLVAREAILLVMGSLSKEEGSNQEVFKRLSRLKFCNPRGGKHYLGEEILIATALELSLSDPLDAITFVRENTRVKYQATESKQSVNAILSRTRSPDKDEKYYSLHEVDYLRAEFKVPNPSYEAIEKAIRRVIAAVIARESKTDQAICTTSFSNIRLASSEGKIVFENIGHLIGLWPILNVGPWYPSGLQILHKAIEDSFGSQSAYRDYCFKLNADGSTQEKITKADLHIDLLARPIEAREHWLKIAARPSDEFVLGRKSDEIELEYSLCLLASVYHQIIGRSEKLSDEQALDRIKSLRLTSLDMKENISASELLDKVEAVWTDRDQTTRGLAAIKMLRWLLEVKSKNQEIISNPLYEFLPASRQAKDGESLIPIAEIDQIIDPKSKLSREEIEGRLKRILQLAVHGALGYDKNQATTSIAPNLRLASRSSGRVVFENIAHFIATWSHFAVKYKLGDQALPGTHRFYSSSPENLSEYQRTQQEIKERMKIAPMIAARHNADLQLEILEEGKQARADYARIDEYQKRYPKAFKVDLEFKYHCLVLKAAIEQAMGGIEFANAAFVAERINLLGFISPDGRDGIHGCHLLNIIESHLIKDSKEQVSGIRAVNLIRDIWKTSPLDSKSIEAVSINSSSPREWFVDLKKNVREAKSGEMICRLKSLDKIFDLRLPSADAFIKYNSIRQGSGGHYWTEHYLGGVIQKVDEVLFKVIIDYLKINRAESRDVFTYEWPDLRLATSDGKVVFQSLAHFLSSASRLEGLMNYELLKVDEFLSGIKLSSKLKEVSESKHGGLCALEFLAAARDFAGHGAEDAYRNKLTTLYGDVGQFPDLQLRSFDQEYLKLIGESTHLIPSASFVSKSSKPEAFRNALIMAKEAIDQSCGSLLIGSSADVADELVKLHFAPAIESSLQSESEVVFQKSGADILSAVILLSGKYANNNLITRDALINAVDLVRDAYAVEVLKRAEPNSVEAIPTKESELDKLENLRTWSEVLSLSPSKIEIGEYRVCRLESLESALQVAFPTAEEYMRKMRLGAGNEAYAHRWSAQFKNQIIDRMEEPLFKVVNEFLQKQAAQKREVYTFEWPEVSFATSEGKVIFHNLAHFISSVKLLESDMHVERARLHELLLGRQSDRVMIKRADQWSGMEFLAVARSVEGIQSKDHYLSKLQKRYGGNACLPDLQLRAFSDDLLQFPQPRVDACDGAVCASTFYHYLIIAREAIEQVCGSLVLGSAEEVANKLIEFDFVSVADERRDSGFDILGSVYSFSAIQKKRKNPKFIDCVSAVEIVRNAYREDLLTERKETPVKKENQFHILLEKIKRNIREPRPGEEVCRISCFEAFLDYKIIDATEFRSRLREGEFKSAGGTQLATYESSIVNPFHDRCESVMEEFLKDRNVGDRSLCTYEWPNIRLATSDGRIVFESFGHFLASLQKLNREFKLEMSKLKSSNVQDKTWGNYTSPLEMLAIIQDFRLVHTHHSMELINRYHNNTIPDLHLRNLSQSVEVDVPISSERARKSSDLKLFKRSLACASEAIMQVMGGLNKGSDSEVVAAISDVLFSDDNGDNIETGYSILLKIEQSSGENQKQGVRTRVSAKRAVRIVREVFNSEIQSEEPDVLSVIPKDLHLPSGALFLALCALNNQENTSKAFSAFEFKFKQVMLSKADQPAITKAPLSVFQQVVELGLGNAITVDVQSISVHYLADLLHQICVRTFDGDINRIIGELENHRSPEFAQQTESRRAVLTQIFDQVIPALEARYRRQLTCQIPESIKMSPYGHQRDAAVGAAFLDKPIMVMEPGTGKTLSLATAIEMLGAEGGLWITKPAVREQTRNNLLDDVFNDKRVRLLSSEDAKKPLAEFSSILESSDYLVCGYNSMRILHEKYPQAFEALNNWLSTRRCILDEAHLIDKRTSGRSQAVLALKASRMLIASGTPYQHDDSRVATLLHIALPKLFPDPITLEDFFKKNPGAARTTLHAYSTVCSIDDVALPFEDPNKIPYVDQLKGGIPRVPIMLTHRKQYELSAEHSATYIDLMLNYPAWAKAHGSESKNKRRAIHLSRLVSYPEQLGLAAPNALLVAIKQIALPVLEKGEKVLILSHRKHPLRLMAKDPELNSYGVVALDGDQSIAERTTLVSELEENNEIQIGLGQMGAVGSGFNIRSVSCVIVLDRPLQTSELYQALRRPVRLLGPGDERFARQTVDINFLEAKLDSSVIEMLDPEEKLAIGEETIYQKLLTRSLLDLERFHSFVVRGESGTVVQPTLEAIISKLETSHRQATRQLDSHRLMSEQVIAGKVSSAVLRYNTPAKNRWRAEELGAFVSKNINKLGRPVEELQVVVLAGPEGLEIPIYTDLGIPASNIHVFEGSKNKNWQKAVREMANSVGAPFYASSVERVLPFIGKKFDIVSIDPDGYTTPALALMFALLPMNDTAMILKNTMAAREQGEAKEMISAVNFRRDLVDAKIVKLLGTRSISELDSLSAVALIREVSRVRAIARTLAPLISEALNIKSEIAIEFLVELALGAPHTKDLKQGGYITPGGLPFQHTFALVERWPSEVSNSNLAMALRGLFVAAHNEIGVASRTTAPNISLQLKSLLKSEGAELVKYFINAAPQQYWLSSLFTDTAVDLA